jgi:beta-lactamase class A
MSFLQFKVPLWSLCVALILSLALAMLLGRAFFSPRTASLPPGVELRERSGRFTNPLLECEVYPDQGVTTLKPFKHKLKAFLDAKIRSGALIDASVYFRDLANGMWFGINESVAYRPASILKVQIMIAYFKIAQANPEFLQQEILYKGDFDLTDLQGLPPEQGLVAGRPYKVEDLIFRMVAYSDNNAARLLLENIDQSVLDMVLQDLNVNVNPADLDRMITAHAYAGLFRVLYNASYLNREFSEKTLDILARSTFSMGIRSGLPEDFTAATKFGEWGESHDSEIVQLHEFGIVYYPDHPYLLGVMTRGRRGQAMDRIIAGVSRLVFMEVDAQHRSNEAADDPR